MASFPVGSRVRGSQLGGLTDAWTPYTPVWTSTGTQPVPAGGSLSGRYRLVGKTLNLRVNFAPLAGTTFGTSLYVWSLPPGITLFDTFQTGVAHMFDVSTSVRSAGTVVIDGTGTAFVVLTAAGGLVAQTVPWTWAVGDFMVVSATLEIA